MRGGSAVLSFDRRDVWCARPVASVVAERRRPVAVAEAKNLSGLYASYWRRHWYQVRAMAVRPQLYRGPAAKVVGRIQGRPVRGP